jgi:hypothetical protein
MSNQKVALAIAARIEERLNKGSGKYTDEISKDLIDNDPRDWLQEAFEEALDLVFYLYVELQRRNNNVKKEVDLAAIRGNNQE